MKFNDITKKLGNKYILVTLIFAVILIFVDQYNIFDQTSNYRKLKKAKKQIEYYDKEIESQQSMLEKLKTDSALMEKIAREQYMMKRENEVIYVIDKVDDDK